MNSKFLLDTNICIALLNAKDQELVKRLRKHQKDCFFICSVVKAELYYGAKKSVHRSQNEERLKIFFEEFQSLPFDDECSIHYGSIRASLEMAGTPIGANDLMIAAIALQNRLTLVSRNTKEFERIPSLQLEIW